MAKIELTKKMENEAPILVAFLARNDGKAAFIPSSVASVATIRWMEQEGHIVRGEEFFELK